MIPWWSQEWLLNESKADAIQYGENDFYCPCRTVDVDITDNLIDKEHEHIIGVEIEPQESEKWIKLLTSKNFNSFLKAYRIETKLEMN